MDACEREVRERWLWKRGAERQTWIWRSCQWLRRPQQPYEHMARLSRKGQNLQEGRRVDTSAGVYVRLLHNFRRPVEPFQHQQSPGQKTNLASQGLSVKKGCLGCKRNWNCLFCFFWEKTDKMSSHPGICYSVWFNPPHACGWGSPEPRIFDQRLMKPGLVCLLLMLQFSRKANGPDTSSHQRTPASSLTDCATRVKMG